MSSLHSVSTPPSIVTDGTYLEDGDPDTPEGPISADTGPALQALQRGGYGAQPSRGKGFGSRLQRAVSNSSDLVGGAAVAAGLKNADAGPVTLLFMGVDAQPGVSIDIGVRPDVLMVVHLDPRSDSCRILSVPRDTRVDLPGYGKSKINHALMLGGIPYQIMVTEDFLGLDIDHYMLIDFVAFQHLVDALGGVSVDVPEDLSKNGELKFPEGTQFFDGERALAFARYRTAPDGDIGRVQRQWALLAGMADALKGRDLVRDVNQMVPAIEAHMRTDLSATVMSEIAKVYGKRCIASDARSIEMLEGSRVRFTDPVFEQSLYYNVVGAEKVRERVAFLLGDDTEEAPQGTAFPEPMRQPSPTPVAADQRHRPHVASNTKRDRRR